MKNLVFLLALTSFCAFGQSPTGRDVPVTWEAPANFAELPYTGYRIYYTDSTGTGNQIDINDPLATSFVVPGVPWGASTWVMTSKCAACAIQESPPSPEIAKVIAPLGDPLPPGNIGIDFGAVTSELTPGLHRYETTVAGVDYAVRALVLRNKSFYVSGRPQ